MASMMITAAALSPASSVPQRRQIPGGYGWPVIGPLSDRLKYYWFEGPNKFFESRVKKYESTVYRVNVPPSFPFFIGVNPRVVAVLDVAAFAHLFDMDLVEKRNVLVGEFMPSTSFTGGMRVCAYLDTSNSNHAQVKGFIMEILKQSSSIWTPSIITSLNAMWESIDASFSDNSLVSAIEPIQKFLFSFLCRSLLGADPTTVKEINDRGHAMIDTWLALQLAPTVVLNRFQPLEEIFLHSFAYPFWLVKSNYEKLANFIESQAEPALQQGQSEFRLTKEEAIHNLLFMLGFNAFGGFSLFFISLLNNLGEHKNVHPQLRQEVREKLSGNDINIEAVMQMDLVLSFVYETLRLSPPVPLQYGRARKDFDLKSHDNIYEIKKGELLCGYQPLVMKDPKIFDQPEEFVFDRFSKANGGYDLLKYLYWSNGPQIGLDGPLISNKQCPGRDFVPLAAAMFLAYMFKRYDEIGISGSNIIVLDKAK